VKGTRHSEDQIIAILKAGRGRVGLGVESPQRHLPILSNRSPLQKSGLLCSLHTGASSGELQAPACFGHSFTKS
jgi:hypothetical protein